MGSASVTDLISVFFLVFPICVGLVLRGVERRYPLSKLCLPDSKHLIVIIAIGSFSFFITHIMMLFIQDRVILAFNKLQFLSIAHLKIPPAFVVFVGFFTCDFINYALHVMSHKIPLFWAFHKIHHADEQVSSLTSFFHHPGEALISAPITLAIYVLLGMPVLSIMLYALCSVILTAISHANIAFPQWTNVTIGRVFVMPSFHRVHHSRDAIEGNSNFGNIFVFWDYIFRTELRMDHALWKYVAFGLPKARSVAPFTFRNLLFYCVINRQIADKRSKRSAS